MKLITAISGKTLCLSSAIVFILFFSQTGMPQEKERDAIKRLFEKVSDPERVKKLREEPEAYDEYIKYLSSPGGNFPEIALKSLTGFKSTSWGTFLVKPYSEEILNEVISWLNSGNERIKNNVSSILMLYVESCNTPDIIVKDRIMPLLLKLKASPSIEKSVIENIQNALLSEKIRTVDKKEAFLLLEDNIKKNNSRLYSIKLLSLLGTHEAIEFLKNNPAYADNNSTFVSIAEINNEISLGKDKLQVYGRYFKDTKIDKDVRIYALWYLANLDNKGKVGIVYDLYSSEKDRLSPELRKEIEAVLYYFELNPDLQGEIKKLKQ